MSKRTTTIAMVRLATIDQRRTPLSLAVAPVVLIELGIWAAGFSAWAGLGGAGFVGADGGVVESVELVL